MFLQDIGSSDVTDIDKVDTSTFNKRQRYQARLKADLRSTFRKEYLSLLVQRANEGVRLEPKLGDIVILGNDNSKRGNWPLARIIEMYPGSDGVVRVVRLRTACGELVRPVQRCYPLEVTEPLPPLACKSSDKTTPVGRLPVAAVCPDEEEIQESVPVHIKQTRAGRTKIPPTSFFVFNFKFK
ncbi:hypothetical protein ILUMI_19870 [Ignelater luminosus]|uniref:DUF5641 domain-containing protein n=1 Tax=Ignelater luminosus TaxID=2038154 RepID=A0A8K0G5F2_IGNLU|nr:hypothetical protein ILUMI_19870 [Ignelater luminosus]